LVENPQLPQDAQSTEYKKKTEVSNIEFHEAVETFLFIYLTYLSVTPPVTFPVVGYRSRALVLNYLN
jgi:hypothetical protein